jgi:hypothetical protein
LTFRNAVNDDGNCMKYRKSALVGIGTGALFVLLSSIVPIANSYHRPELAWGRVVSVDVGVRPPALLLGGIGFALGFFFTLRRSRISN